MILLLLKATLIFALPLAALPLMNRASAAMRHLVCAIALAAALLLPLTLLIPATPAVFRIAVTAAAGRVAAAAPQSTPSLTVIWAVVAAAFLVRLAIGFRRVTQTTRAMTKLSAGIYEADVSVPVVCGLFEPAILLPRGAHGWTVSERDAAIRHERAHIQRKDLWTGFMAHFTCALYWFHPLAWIVAAMLRREQEVACDDAVICSGFDSAVYAEALVAAARAATSTVLLTGCSMLTPKTLKVRIVRLLDAHVSRATSKGALLRTGLAAATVLIAIGTLKPVIAQDGPLRMGPGMTAPTVIYKTDPEYSEGARKAKMSGTVTLSVVVGTDGKARDCKVVRSLDPELDANAIKAVQQWRFKPGVRNDAPVDVRAMIEVNFRLLDDPQ